MAIEKLKRVIWTLQEMKTKTSAYSHKQIRQAIMEEIGTDERTISTTIKKLAELGLLKRAEFGSMKINKDVTK